MSTIQHVRIPMAVATLKQSSYRPFNTTPKYMNYLMATLAIMHRLLESGIQKGYSQPHCILVLYLSHVESDMRPIYNHKALERTIRSDALCTRLLAFSISGQRHGYKKQSKQPRPAFHATKKLPTSNKTFPHPHHARNPYHHLSPSP